MNGSRIWQWTGSNPLTPIKKYVPGVRYRAPGNFMKGAFVGLLADFSNHRCVKRCHSTFFIKLDSALISDGGEHREILDTFFFEE